MTLSVLESKMLRGLGIMSIAMHNFAHTQGFVRENEKVFIVDRWNDFWYICNHPDANFLLNLFSFIGWCGVPVFVFLSGFGLVQKHEKSLVPIRKTTYLVNNFKKLFLLMLPGVIIFIVWDLLHFNIIGGGRKILFLTLMNNLICPINAFVPGVYWYFGFTFQLYIVYLVLTKIRNKALFATFFVLSLVVLFVIPQDCGFIMRYLKNNFVGWLPIFLLGIWMSRHPNKLLAKLIPSVIFIFTGLLFSMLMLYMNSNYYLWILMPFASLFMFLFLVKGVSSLKIISKPLIWLGTYSSAIFVVHPIARIIINSTSTILAMHNAYILLLVYLVMTLIMAYYYNKFYTFLRKRYC